MHVATVKLNIGFPCSALSFNLDSVCCCGRCFLLTSESAIFCSPDTVRLDFEFGIAKFAMKLYPRLRFFDFV